MSVRERGAPLWEARRVRRGERDKGGGCERGREMCSDSGLVLLQVAAEKGAEMRKRLHLPCTPHWAVLLDTKGPEIRTAMLKYESLSTVYALLEGLKGAL